MLISVVIPLYNKEKYILRAIESVLSQTYSNFELIIVDDGSTDRSVEKIESKFDGKIRIIKQANEGVSKARNTGVKNASAEWVAFLDADDEYQPLFLEEVKSFIISNKHIELSFVGTNYFIGNTTRIAVDSSISSGIYDYFKLFGNQKSPNHSSTTCVNKKAFLKVGGFPEGVKQFEDWITWFKLAFVGSFGYINKPLGFYHFIDGSVANTRRSPKAFYNDAILVPKTINKYINKYKVNRARKKLIKFCISEFSLNIAIFLVRHGSKKYSVKMHKFVYDPTVYFRNTKKTTKLIMHLLIPKLN